MRTDKELIQLMIDNFDEFFYKSLCITTQHIRGEDIISYDEQLRIDNIVHKYRPEGPYNAFFWPIHEIKPRREFLQNILNKLQ